MQFRQVVPSAGLVVGAVLGAAGLGYLYLSSERLRLEEQTRREIAQAGRDLKSILSGLTSSASAYFVEPEKRGPKSIRSFAHRNPYIEDTAADNNKQSVTGLKGVCAYLENPRQITMGGVTLDVDTTAIIDDIAISETFEYLFISKADGTVVFAIEHGEASRHRNGLGWIDSRSREHDNRDHPVISLPNVGGLLGANGERLKASDLALSSVSQPVILGTKNYELFAYPIQIGSAGPCTDVKTKEQTWIVGGLVDPARMWTEAATLSPRVTLVIVLVLVLGFAAVPMFKLFLLQPNERFRFVDACILVPSAILVLMIATVLLLAWGAHDQLDDLAGGGLKDLSRYVEAQMTAELATARSQLMASEIVFAETLKRSCPNGVPAGEKTIAVNEDIAQFLKIQGPTVPTIYRDLASLWWIDRNGAQVFKADVHSEATSRQKLPDRPYFREPSQGRLWQFDRQDKTGFFVQSLHNNSTGELTTVLSMQSQVCNDYIAAISMAPLFVEHPSLPAGYNFAVIAADGQVLYHSDARRTLKEDFFSQVAGAEPLHAAIQSLRPGDELSHVIRTTYGRAPVDLQVRKIGWAGPHWFLVTLRDRRWLEAANTEALVHATAWCLAAWAPMLIAFAAWVVLRGKSILRSLWPSPDRAGFYCVLFWTACSLFAVGLISISFWPRASSQALFVFSCGFPWTVLVLVGLASRFNLAPPQARATWYTLAAASLWATFAIVPAVGVYRYSWHHALDKLSGFETRQQQARAEDWNARDRWLYKEKNIEVAADDAHKGENENRFYVYRRKQMMQFGVDYSGASSGLEQTWLEDWLDRNLPFYDEPVESFRFQLPSSGEGPIRASDQSGAWFFSWLSAITCLAAAAAAYAWLRIHIQRLFWMSISCPETAEETETQHCLLVLAQSAAEKRCLRGLLERPRAVAASTAAGAGGASSFVSCKDLVIDFEASFEKDDDQRREDLEALEEALQQPDRWVVVLAQSDPLSLLEREGSPAPSTDQEQQQRWAAALKRLTASASLSSPRSLAMPASEVLWRQLSREEQLILIQVAEEGFANPRNELAMQQLLRKGILRFDPGLEVTNERIERFAHERARTEEVKEWERPARSIGWRGTRWIFPVLMVLGLAFATSTGQTWLKSATGVLTVLATGLEALWKVLGAVQKPRSSTG